MPLHRDRIPNLLDSSVRTNQKSTTYNSFKQTAHELFGTPDAIGFDHFMRGIAEQREIELLFFLEARERSLGISAGAQNCHIVLIEVPLCVTELGRFGRSTRCVGFGKKEQHHALAFKIRK